MIPSNCTEMFTLLGVFLGLSGFILQFEVSLEVLAEGICIAGGSTPTYTQLEVSLLSIPLSCLAIGHDIWTYKCTIRWFTSKLQSGTDSNQNRTNIP